MTSQQQASANAIAKVPAVTSSPSPNTTPPNQKVPDTLCTDDRGYKGQGNNFNDSFFTVQRPLRSDLDRAYRERDRYRHLFERANKKLSETHEAKDTLRSKFLSLQDESRALHRILRDYEQEIDRIRAAATTIETESDHLHEILQDNLADGDSEWESGSIASIGSSSTLVGSIASGPIQSGIQHATKFLLENEILYPLFQTTFKNSYIGVDRFRRNFARVLAYFGKELMLEATNTCENEAATFFRKYRLVIANVVSMNIAETNLEPNIANEKKTSGGTPPETNISGYNRGADIENESECEDEVDDEVDDESECMGEGETSINEHFDFESAKSFILSSYAFLQMIRRLSDFICPSFGTKAQKLAELSLPHRDIDDKQYWIDMKFKLMVTITELQESCPQQIMVDLKSSESRLDRFMAAIESITKEEWNWWPFTRPKYPLRPSEARIGWRCKCNNIRWEAVPISFARGIVKLLDTFPLSPELRAEPSISSAPEPVTAKPSISTKAINTPGHSTSMMSASPSSHGSQAQYSHQNVLKRPRYIFLVAKSNRPKLRQLRSLHLNTEEFGKELRKTYQQLKGFWRSWFSPYEFSHCDFRMFEKFSSRNYALRQPGIPPISQSDYYYAPRPALYDPPISPEEFNHIFTYTVHNKRHLFTRTLPFFNFMDKLSQDTVNRIPQRYCYLDENGVDRELFWGLYIRERRSALMTSVYIILCLSPFLVFCALYIGGYVSGDIQNATTPFALTLSCLALFLSSLIHR